MVDTTRPWTAWIDGARVAPRRDDTRPLINPATEEAHDEVVDSDPAEVDRAISAAREAFKEWRSTSPAERSRILLRLADLIEREANTLSMLEVEDTGKPLATMRDGELSFAVDNLRFFAGSARSLEGTGAGSFNRGYLSLLTRHPVGVVGALAPWNFPLIMAIWKAGAALAAGCTVVLKPAPNTPRTSIALAELAREAGLPAGVINVVLGGHEVGRAIVEHPGVDMVSLTGSTDTGRQVMAQAAKTLKRVVLELGGKAPFVVFGDVDLEVVVPSAVLASTYNCGQDCTAATRIYVERALLPEFTDALANALGELTIGDPLDPEVAVGPLISGEHRERVRGFVDRAEAEGANVITVGSVPDRGFFFPPVVVLDADQRSEIVQDEVFGPVVTVLGFDDEEEAVALANDVRYGLAASVWTHDVGRALRVGSQLESGVVWINDHLPIVSEMPHGGVKQSGFGKDMSQEAVLEHTVSRHMMIRHLPPERPEGFRPN